MREKLACMFSMWYPAFRDVTFESRVLDLPSDVLDYLMSDGTLVLPSETSTHATLESSNRATSTTDDDDSGDDDWDDVSETLVEPEFKEFSVKVQRCVSELGGAVLPKLNWSAPRDATWMSFDGTLRCSTLNEILLLLKSSQFITHDLVLPFEVCDQPEFLEEMAVSGPCGASINASQPLSNVQFNPHPDNALQTVPSGSETDVKVALSHVSRQLEPAAGAASSIRLISLMAP